MPPRFLAEGKCRKFLIIGCRTLTLNEVFFHSAAFQAMAHPMILIVNITSLVGCLSFGYPRKLSRMNYFWKQPRMFLKLDKFHVHISWFIDFSRSKASVIVSLFRSGQNRRVQHSKTRPSVVNYSTSRRVGETLAVLICHQSSMLCCTKPYCLDELFDTDSGLCKSPPGYHSEG